MRQVYGFRVYDEVDDKETVIGQDLFNKESGEWEYSEIRLSWSEIELLCVMIMGDENV